MSVTFIVHGDRWPEPAAIGTLRARLREAVPDAQIIEAREEASRARGAAATVNDAAVAAEGDVLFVLEPWVAPDPTAIRAACSAAVSGLIVASGADGLSSITEHDDAVPEDLVADLASRPLDDVWPGEMPWRAAPMWAMPRGRFAELDGLDPRLGSVRYLDDLASRARVRGVPVTTMALGAGDAPAAWPIEPTLVRVLGVRNRLIAAFKSFEVDRLGVELARVATACLLASWRATGLRAESFDFGGTWGRGEGRLARALAPGAHGASQVPHHDRLLEPLLALDAFLDEVPELVSERQRWAPGPSPALGVGMTFSRSCESHPDPSPATRRGGGVPASPTVSVIVVNWNGLEHLETCFRSLEASDYPAERLDIICVDNGSTDGSVAFLRREFPAVSVVSLETNRGFTGGNEAGVAASRGDILAFFNNDMRVAPDAIGRLVQALDAETPCAAARVLSWDGRHIDFLRGALNFEARGFQDFYGEPADGERQSSADTFFANGGAFAVTREAYLRAGGFDPALFAYYDDVDLGWRLRLTGAGIRVEDRAVVYHRHGATSQAQPIGQKRFLMERNALRTAMKNYSEATLRRTLGAMLLLAARRLLDESRLARTATPLAALGPFDARVRRSFRPRAGRPRAGASGRDAPLLRGFAAESFAAIGATLETLPELARDRAAVQGARTTPEATVLSHFGRTFESLSSVTSYQPIHRALVSALELPRVFNARTRLLVISHEAIAANMSGPAVRFLELGRALSSVARVTLAMPGSTTVRDDRCTIVGFDPNEPSTLRRLAEDADVLFVQGFTLAQFPFLSGQFLPIVVDLYCPFTIEHLEQTRGDAVRARAAAGILGVQNAQLDAGDFFICASDMQRDFWLGNLHSRGRVNPRTYADDPTLRRLIDVVPFGLPDEPMQAALERARAMTSSPSPAPPVMKGARDGIAPHDRVLLWAGSLLDWQDPLTLIRAVAAIATRRSDVKLFFMGTKHPNPLVTPMRIVEESQGLAAELGVLDTHVFFNDWVPYDQRARYLAEADLGVSTHREHLETHFSFRTRMLDYVWAGVPIVCTRGDVFADLVAARNLGMAVEPGSVDALAQALESMLDDGPRREQARRGLEVLASELTWSRVAGPLAAFVANPRHAADRSTHIGAFRDRLADKFVVSRWLKRTAVHAGVSEARIEQIKRWKAVQQLMVLRNRVAIARAQR